MIKSGEFDIILLDTSHDTMATQLELQKYVPMIKSGGYFFVHDTDGAGVGFPLKEYMIAYKNLELIKEKGDFSRMTLLKKL